MLPFPSYLFLRCLIKVFLLSASSKKKKKKPKKSQNVFLIFPSEIQGPIAADQQCASNSADTIGERSIWIFYVCKIAIPHCANTILLMNKCNHYHKQTNYQQNVCKLSKVFFLLYLVEGEELYSSTVHIPKTCI